MVDRCHRTMEDVIRKVMTEQTDWLPTLNSVLFSICCQVHSSTGFSPFHMLYDKDPILPFQVLDKMCEMGEDNNDIDPVSQCFLMLENGREKIFDKAKENIKESSGSSK